MSRQGLHRKHRRIRGLCEKEGCLVLTGDDACYCPLHARRQAAKSRRYRARMRTQGAAA